MKFGTIPLHCKKEKNETKSRNSGLGEGDIGMYKAIECISVRECV